MPLTKDERLAVCTCDSIDEDCPKDPNGMNIHSYEWWDGTGPCTFCGASTCPACDTETGEHP